MNYNLIILQAYNISQQYDLYIFITHTSHLIEKLHKKKSFTDSFLINLFIPKPTIVSLTIIAETKCVSNPL